MTYLLYRYKIDEMRRSKPSTLILSLLVSFSLGMSWSAPKNLDDNEVASHLKEFASVNSNHHDNIDDVQKDHSHKHKHSEDGEEHEHEHKHSDATQGQVQGLFASHNSFTGIGEIESKNSFFEKNLFSNPFLDGIFRPPIS